MSANTTSQVAIYLRVSTAEQAQEGTSLSTQRSQCEAHARAKGWEVVGVYEDAGVSGAQASRPALDKILVDVARHKVQAVLVHKMDRLARDELIRLTIMRELHSYGAALVSLDRPGIDLGSDEGELIDGVLGTFAAFERKRIARRTRAGINARVRQGGWGGGQVAPFGYRIMGVESDAHLEVDHREAQVVRSAVSLVLDFGLSTLQAAQRLNSLGLTPRSAPLWTSQNLRNCLKRGQWGGVWTFGKTSPKGTVPEPIEVPVEPILSAERAEALRRHLEVTQIKRGTKGVHPLSGRLFCLCGQPMTGIARSDRANRRYRCRHGRNTPAARSAATRACWATR